MSYDAFCEGKSSDMVNGGGLVAVDFMFSSARAVELCLSEAHTESRRRAAHVDDAWHQKLFEYWRHS